MHYNVTFYHPMYMFVLVTPNTYTKTKNTTSHSSIKPTTLKKEQIEQKKLKTWTKSKWLPSGGGSSEFSKHTSNKIVLL